MSVYIYFTRCRVFNCRARPAAALVWLFLLHLLHFFVACRLFVTLRHRTVSKRHRPLMGACTAVECERGGRGEDLSVMFAYEHQRTAIHAHPHFLPAAQQLSNVPLPSPPSSFNPLTSLLHPLPFPLCLALLLRCRRPLSVKAGSSLTCVCALCSHHGNHLFSQAQQQHTNTHRERQSQSHIHTHKARQTNSITHTQNC